MSKDESAAALRSATSTQQSTRKSTPATTSSSSATSTPAQLTKWFTHKPMAINRALPMTVVSTAPAVVGGNGLKTPVSGVESSVQPTVAKSRKRRKLTVEEEEIRSETALA